MKQKKTRVLIPFIVWDVFHQQSPRSIDRVNVQGEGVLLIVIRTKENVEKWVVSVEKAGEEN